MRFKLILLTVLLIFGINNVSFSQKHKPFSGMLVYNITVTDTALTEYFPTTSMVLYTNDTIVRMENESQAFGKQITIRHMTMDKSYQLLDTDFGKFAIQTKGDNVSEDANDTTRTVKRYTFEKSRKKKKILGKKAKSVKVSSKFYEEDKLFYYYKDYSGKYINTFPEINGLPVEYYVVTFDAIFKYELVRMMEYQPDNDLFGIPSDFERISFDAFMDKLIESKSLNTEEGN